MANTLLTAPVIAEMALATLYESLIVAQLAHRDYEPDFGKRQGDAITIRKPAVFTSTEYVRANGITIQDATESGIPMTLNHFRDTSFSVTSEDYTLKIDDFDAQFLTPAMMAIAEDIDRDLIKQLNQDVTQVVGAVTPNAAGEDYQGYQGAYPWSDSRVLIQAKEVLQRNKVPMMDRYALTGPTTSARWEAEKAWRNAEKRGSTEGLKEASLGDRVAGFTPYETQNIAAPAQTPATGQPTTEVSFAWHKTALALAMRPLELPKGAANAYVANFKGLSLRVVMAYDINKKLDVCSIDCLYGTKVIDPLRAVKIRGALA